MTAPFAISSFLSRLFGGELSIAFSNLTKNFLSRLFGGELNRNEKILVIDVSKPPVRR